MMLIARRSFFFTALQFVVITSFTLCQKETTTLSKHHSTEDFRLNAINYKTFIVINTTCRLQQAN
jgi:hypothetical protein